MTIKSLYAGLIGIGLVATMAILLVLGVDREAGSVPRHLQQKAARMEQAGDITPDAAWVAGGE